MSAVLWCFLGLFALVIFAAARGKKKPAPVAEAQFARENQAMFEMALGRIPDTSPISSSVWCQELARVGFEHAFLLRDAELIFDSLRIASRSPNPDVASQRMTFAKELWRTNGFPLAQIVSGECAEKLQADYAQAVSRAHVGSVVAQVSKDLKKYQSLLTEKAKHRCMGRMMATVKAAAASGLVDLENLKIELSAVGLSLEITDDGE